MRAIWIRDSARHLARYVLKSFVGCVSAELENFKVGAQDNDNPLTVFPPSRAATTTNRIPRDDYFGFRTTLVAPRHAVDLEEV
jgi:hypothetical protein